MSHPTLTEGMLVTVHKPTDDLDEYPGWDMDMDEFDGADMYISSINRRGSSGNYTVDLSETPLGDPVSWVFSIDWLEPVDMDHTGDALARLD